MRTHHTRAHGYAHVCAHAQVYLVQCFPAEAREFRTKLQPRSLRIGFSRKGRWGGRPSGRSWELGGVYRVGAAGRRRAKRKVAGGVHPSPIPFADVVTTTTHKTLRGPRGGMILMNDEAMAKKVNSALFPGLQGGPLMHTIAAKAVAFKEALEPSFKEYVFRVVENAKVLSSRLSERGIDIVSGGTDTHLLLVDLQSKKVTGRDAEVALGSVGITCNKNGIPFDPLKPAITSGIRLGSPACTTRGFGQEEFQMIADLIADILDSLSNTVELDARVYSEVRNSVHNLCKRFPIY